MRTAHKLLTVLKSGRGGADPDAAYVAIVEGLSPVLYWKFDEASGTTAIDYGSAGGNVTYSASDIAGQTTGPFGGVAARMVAADSDYIDLGTGGTVESNWPANELTISGWVRGYDGAWADAVQNLSLSINSASEFLWLQNVNIPNTLNYRYKAATTLKQATAVLSPVPGTTWHHIMWTISLSNDRLFLYFDNAQILTTTGLPTWTGAAWSLARLGSNGAAYGNFDYAHWAVFDSELDATARTALYNGGPV